MRACGAERAGRSVTRARWAHGARRRASRARPTVAPCVAATISLAAGGLPLLALGACLHSRTHARSGALPATVSAFTADFDSARVIAIGLQGHVERYPDRLMVVVERAQLPPLTEDETIRAALARPGARGWVIGAASAPIGRDWFQHDGEQAWTPIRFVVPLGATSAAGDDDLVFVFERGVGQRGGAARRVVPAVVRPPGPVPDASSRDSGRRGT